MKIFALVWAVGMLVTGAHIIIAGIAEGRMQFLLEESGIPLSEPRKFALVLIEFGFNLIGWPLHWALILVLLPAVRAQRNAPHASPAPPRTIHCQRCGSPVDGGEAWNVAHVNYALRRSSHVRFCSRCAFEALTASGRQAVIESPDSFDWEPDD